MKITVAKKISLLNIVAGVGILLLAGFSSWQMERVYAAANFTNDNTVPALVALSRVEAWVGKLRQRAARHVFYADDAASMAEVETTMAAAREKISAALKEYESTIADSENRSRFEQVAKRYATLLESFEPALESSRNGRKDEARDRLHHSDALGKELSDALVEYAEYNVSRGKTSSEQAKAIHRQAEQISIAITLLTLAASAGIGYAVARSVRRPLAAMQDAVARIGNSGDLTIRVPATTADELGDMGRQLNETLGRVAQSVRSVTAIAHEVAGNADHLAAATAQLTESSHAQAATAAEMAAAVEQITVSIGSVADHAAVSEALTGQASTHVSQGASVIEQASRQMSRNAEQLKESSAHIARLSEQSGQVGGIVQVIREIADQTNLLALNAAIEAARAGETGRGFAVVADEVRKLAERTATATAEIGQLIENIQHEVATAVDSMDTSSKLADGSAALAEEAGRVFVEISGSADQAAERVRDIAVAAREQNSAGQGMAGNVEKVARMTEENSAATESISSAAGHLKEQAERLEEAVSHFRT